jgi:tetratricopeptide (TPR) repeat protein
VRPSFRHGLLAACAVSVFALWPAPLRAQVLVGPGESTETVFRKEIRGQWFAWLAAQEEGDTILARAKVGEILKHAQKIEIRRLSDLALSATLLGNRQLLSGKTDLAREAFSAAVRLDPDLPEPRWARASLAASTNAWKDVPAELFGAFRAALADSETRRSSGARAALVLLATLVVMAVACLFVLFVHHGRRYLHDLREVAGRFFSGQADYLLVAAFFAAPFLLSFDVFWFGLVLFVALFGYATWPQRLAASVVLALLFPLIPLLDGIAYNLAVSSSPILRGAEALEESRYDQRVIDNLEAAKNVAPADVDIRFLLGRLYQALGQNDRAIAEYTHGAEVSPRESRCLVNRGNIRFVDGDFGSAQEDYQAALKRDPFNIAARYNLALLYAETFRTTEASQALQEARALDARQVQGYQDTPTLVKVVSQTFTPAEARRKIEAMRGDRRSRRLLGHYRGPGGLGAWLTPLLFGVPAALVLAVVLDRRRKSGRGYSSECQKCGRTFCRLCKPPGESALLCSQCVHVYLKKDGVAIETKLQKLEDVKRRRAREGRVRVGVNLILPGSAAFLDSKVIVGGLAFFLFAVGIIAILSRDAFAVVPRPGVAAAWIGLSLWGTVSFAGWLLGQVTARRA